MDPNERKALEKETELLRYLTQNANHYIYLVKLKYFREMARRHEEEIRRREESNEKLRKLIEAKEKEKAERQRHIEELKRREEMRKKK